MRAIYTSAVSEIVTRCPHITKLAFGPTFIGFPSLRDQQIPLNTDMAFDYQLYDHLRDIFPQLTAWIIWDDCFPPGTTPPTYPPMQMLDQMPNLVYLDVPLGPLFTRATSGTTPSLEYPPLSLPYLEDMTVCHDDLHLALEPLSKWQLPRLRRINLQDRAWYGNAYPAGNDVRRLPSAAAITAFCRAHSATMKKFTLSCRYTLKAQDVVLSAIKHLAASLEYVVLPLAWPQEAIDAILSLLPIDEKPDQLHVDLWGPHPYPSPDPFGHELRCRKAGNHLLVGGEGRLRPNVRILDPTLSYIPNVLRVFRPSTRPPLDAPVFHSYFGMHIVETRFALFQLGSESLFIWRTHAGEGEMQSLLRREHFSFEEWSSGQLELSHRDRCDYAAQKFSTLRSYEEHANESEGGDEDEGDAMDEDSESSIDTDYEPPSTDGPWSQSMSDNDEPYVYSSAPLGDSDSGEDELSEYGDEVVEYPPPGQEDAFERVEDVLEVFRDTLRSADSIGVVQYTHC
ncbi:hypothetical protein EIP91_009602 [Steccherinum ochraceum]|uniref:Uncharacterized protein n=1 Tax=Steccherinum ochraceum TaxID=92696 RepID=A0A4R0R9J7_9APHY|nr:hypothetical protein EIP91_009602 [Steccherinum ochraceum]